jgi:hypothetical protein
VTYQPDEEFDEFGEDENGRKLVAARAAAEGKFILLETHGGYVAIPAGTKIVADTDIDPLMAELGIDFEVAPADWTRYREIGVSRTDG